MGNLLDNGGLIGKSINFDTDEYYQEYDAAAECLITQVGDTKYSPVIDASYGFDINSVGTTIEVEEGDLILIWTASDNEDPSGGLTNGWAALSVGTTSAHMHVYYKFITADLSTVAPVTGSTKIQWAGAVFRNVDTNNVWAISNYQAVSANLTIGSIQGSSENGYVIALGALDDDEVGSGIIPPSGMDLMIAADPDGAGAKSTIMGAKIRGTSGDTGSSLFFSSPSGDSYQTTIFKLDPKIGGDVNKAKKNSGMWNATKTNNVRYEDSPSGIWDLNDNFYRKKDAPYGQAEFTTPGTFNWICPEGVRTVSVVCVGGGGGGESYNTGSHYMHGGGGGALGYINNYSVTPGATYQVVVGIGGQSRTYNTQGDSGGDSFFESATIVKGGGGIGGVYSTFTPQSEFVGDGGGKGGGSQGQNANGAVGGGGAGGYSGDGGCGANTGTGTAITAGAGGAGGGGYTNGSSIGWGGGGVGIYGEGTSGGPAATVGRRGSGGQNASGDAGAEFGGGGGGSNGDSTTNDGAGGAVRIIWGNNRSFPSTNTANA